jgi:hypothetical protein
MLPDELGSLSVFVPLINVLKHSHDLSAPFFFLEVSWGSLINFGRRPIQNSMLQNSLAMKSCDLRGNLRFSEHLAGRWFSLVAHRLLQDGIGVPPTIPTTEHLDGSRFRLHPVKHLEVFLYDQSPDCGTLTNFWMTLWKETEAFTALNNHVTQLARG